MFTQVDDLSAVSDNVLQFRLKRPFRLLADLLAKPTPYASAIMPERLALAASWPAGDGTRRQRSLQVRHGAEAR